MRRKAVGRLENDTKCPRTGQPIKIQFCLVVAWYEEEWSNEILDYTNNSSAWCTHTQVERFASWCAGHGPREFSLQYALIPAWSIPLDQIRQSGSRRVDGTRDTGNRFSLLRVFLPKQSCGRKLQWTERTAVDVDSVKPIRYLSVHWIAYFSSFILPLDGCGCNSWK